MSLNSEDSVMRNLARYQYFRNRHLTASQDAEDLFQDAWIHLNHSNTMSSVRRTDENEVCRQVRQDLPREFLGELDELSSSSLFQHVRHCRSCLTAYLTLQVAADLAGVNAR